MVPIKPRISVHYPDDATVVSFTEEKILDEADISAIQDSIISVIGQGERIKLVLDFGNVKFLSSAVLGLLIRISKKTYENGGQLKLCSIDPKIYQIFKITRLTKIFDICKNLEIALESFAQTG
ncbi:MAG: STAS domain-containing protein [Planctomycetota bacterium]|jgi:anti-sigma B factor antagonist